MFDLLRPLTALLIADSSSGALQAILDGTKTIAIRVGHRDYQAGDRVMLCCHLESWAVLATVSSVRHTWLDAVTLTEWKADGFDSHDDEMVEALEGFYGELLPNRNITVIRWKDLEGLLIQPKLEAPLDPESLVPRATEATAPRATEAQAPEGSEEEE